MTAPALCEHGQLWLPIPSASTSCAAGIPGTGPCSPTDCPPGPGCRRARHTVTEGSTP